MDGQKKKQILIHFKCSCSPICISVPPFLEELLLIGIWMKKWEEEIVAMNRHRFDESNDLIFTVFIIVIKTFPQRNPFILIFAIEAIVVEYHLFFIG